MLSRKENLEEELIRAKDRVEQLASNRQMYKDMEEQDSTLHALRKECDDWTEKEHRLNMSLETLRDTLPRLLTKVCC